MPKKKVVKKTVKKVPIKKVVKKEKEPEVDLGPIGLDSSNDPEGFNEPVCNDQLNDGRVN